MEGSSPIEAAPPSVLAGPARDATGPELRRIRQRQPIAPKISIVVPVFNEEESIDIFLAAVEAAVPAASYDLEFVFIDDGSRDSTLDVLWRAADADPASA